MDARRDSSRAGPLKDVGRMFTPLAGRLVSPPIPIAQVLAYTQTHETLFG
jgi:hypothetical protein